MLKRYFSEGRFVNPTYTAGYGNKLTEVYEQIKQRGYISGYSKWNNDVPKGQRPSQSEISENNQAYGQYATSWRAVRGEVFGRLAESAEATENEIAPTQTSSKDGIFFDGSSPQYSLSAEGATPTYGRGNVYGKDIALEEIAPTKTAQETAKTEQNVPKMENVAPVAEDMFPNDLSPIAESTVGVDTDRALDYDSTTKETESGVNSNERREETRDAFYRRANAEIRTVRERGKIACGYILATDKTGRAGQTERALQVLGIQAIVHEGLEANVDGVTKVIRGDASSLPGDAVYVRNSMETDPIETAGHEAYHFWKRVDSRAKYTNTIIDNIDFSSDEFVQFQKDISETYFGEEVGIEDDGADKLTEEIFAYITGFVYAGDSNNIVRPFLRDYDAVKAAWDELAENQAQASPISKAETNAGLDELAPVGNLDSPAKNPYNGHLLQKMQKVSFLTTWHRYPDGKERRCTHPVNL